jgi:hypothetical protein
MSSSPASGTTAAVPRSADRLAAGGAVLSLVLVLVAALFAPVRDVLLRFLPDDAFYYLEIARHLGLGDGSTFDGINRTNGYHPLWLLMLAPFAPLMEASRAAGARIALALGAVLFTGAYLLIGACARRLAPENAFLAVLFPAAALSFNQMYGMESALATCLLAALLWRLSRSDLHRVRDGALLGALGGLLVLARLDAAVYVLVMDLVWLVRLLQAPNGPGRRAEWRAFIVCGLVQAGLVLPYVVSNVLLFGHVLTVSAAVKAGRRGSINLLWARGNAARLSLLVLLIGLVVLFLSSRRDRRDSTFLTALGGTLATMALVAWKGGFESFHWYFTLPLLCGGLFLSLLLTRLHERGLGPRGLQAGALAFCLVVFGMTLRSKLIEPKRHLELYDRAVWIARFAPPEAVFAEPDCGMLGYFSRHPFMNTDGLSNSFEFQEALADDRLPQWFAEKGLNAMALPAAQSPWRAADGSLGYRLKTDPGLHGEVRKLTAVLTAWPTPGAEPSHRLWRVVDVVRDSPDQAGGQ